eukprot:s1941_g3.t1
MDVLEAGFPVMFYNPKSKSFQNRVVKVDRQLSFFFVLEERQLKQPVAVRLYEIDEVLSSTQAFEILAEFNLQDEYATEKTTTVCFHGPGPTKETALTLDKLLILLAPPAMKLHEHIAACVELSKSKFSADAGDEEGVRLKDSGRYLDCARIGSCGPVFFHYATGVDLEFTLRAADVVEKQEFEPKQPITHALHFPMDATTVGTEIDKLVERLGILPALDLTRLRLVVYEMVLHRQWISPNIRLFAGGMYDFMQDQGGIAACFKVPIELRQKLFEGIPAPRRKMDVRLGAVGHKGIGFAVNYLPVKSCDIGDGIFFSAAMSVGILLVGLATGMFLTSTPDFEIPAFEPLAAAGGAMWMLGNLMCPYIIKLIGLGLGLTVWDLSNMLMGWFTGYFGLFGMQRETNVQLPAMNFAGLILASLSLIFFSLASAWDEVPAPAEGKAGKHLEVESRDRSGSDHSNLDGHEVSANNRQMDLEAQKGSLPEPKAGSSAMLGFSMAIVAGLLFGSTFDLPMDLKDGDFGTRHSHDIMDYVFSHFIGIFLAAAVFLLIYVAIKGRKSHVSCKLILPSLASGVIWGIAQVAWFQANIELGFAVAFPIIGSLPGIIGLFIGLCCLGEVRTYRSRICAGLGMLLRVPGVLLIAAHYYSHCALDATILALKHLLSLEDVHQPLEELRKGMEELEKGARDDRAAELREALRTAPLSTQPDEGILQRVRQLASSEESMEASAEGRNSRHSLLAFSEEGFHDDAVPSRRRLSSYHMMAETMDSRHASPCWPAKLHSCLWSRIQKELEPSRRNSLVTFSETESGAGAAGPPRRQRLSSYGMFAEQTDPHSASVFDVGLEPHQVELFCGSAPDGCTNCCKPLAGHTVYKVETELNELCRILQMKAAFLEAEDGELPSLEGEMKAWIYAEDPESEELDPCRAFTPSGSEEVQGVQVQAVIVAEPVPDALADGPGPPSGPPGPPNHRTAEIGTALRPKKKAGLVARAWALLGCQSGAKAGRQTPEGTGSEAERGEAAERPRAEAEM